MKTAYLLLGSNEGNRTEWLKRAIALIDEGCGAIMKQSAVYETAAWGITAQPDFLNMVVEVETDLAPADLLACVLHVENQLGRKRDVKWGPRTIDIDILLYGSEIIDQPELKVPHPYLQERRFTLAPLAELAPDYIHPVLHQTINELLAVCPDELEVRRKGAL